MIISSKAGYLMWPGPYGEWGSRKYLVASCDQSLARMGLKYVDIFYSHRFDPDTPLERPWARSTFIVRSGRALYAGISSYDAEQTARAAQILKQLGTPCLIHQPELQPVQPLDRGRTHRRAAQAEDGLHRVLAAGAGHVVQQVSRTASRKARVLRSTPRCRPIGCRRKRIAQIRKLNEIAQRRGQSLAQMAVAWTLRDPVVTSSLIGASKVAHVEEAVAAVNNTAFSAAENAAIEAALK
jgi:L-glyceraldehyde 3-phosphate reductase